MSLIREMWNESIYGKIAIVIGALAFAVFVSQLFSLIGSS